MLKNNPISFASPTPVCWPSHPTNHNIHNNRRNDLYLPRFLSNPRTPSNRRIISLHCTQTSARPRKELNIRMRPAKAKDVPRIMNMVMQENMNPLIGSLDRFIVYEADLESHKSGAQTHKCAERNKIVIGCGQVRRGVPAEMSTIVVDPAWRQLGVGSLLVSELLKRYGNNERIVLVTLSNRYGFYQRFGFAILDEHDRAKLPLKMRVEFWLCTIAARFFAPQDHFICMAREAKQSHKLPSLVNDVRSDKKIGCGNIFHQDE